jgi:hypothetical protein
LIINHQQIFELHFAWSISVKNILNLIVYSQSKLWDKKKAGLICSRSTNELMNPYWIQTKRENSGSSQLKPSSGIIVLRYYLTIYNQRHQNLSKKEE